MVSAMFSPNKSGLLGSFMLFWSPGCLPKKQMSGQKNKFFQANQIHEELLKLAARASKASSSEIMFAALRKGFMTRGFSFGFFFTSRQMELNLPICRASRISFLIVSVPCLVYMPQSHAKRKRISHLHSLYACFSETFL